MAKFKVGDRVKDKIFGKGVIEPCDNSTGMVVVFDKPDPMLHDGTWGKMRMPVPNRCWFVSENGADEPPVHITLRTPKRPWHDASEVPTHNNNVKVKLDDGSKAIGYYAEECGWHVYPPDSRSPSRATCGDTRVRRWRELKSAKPEQPAEEAPAEAEHPLAVGDRVVFEGVIARIDGDSRPYCVEDDNGYVRYFQEGVLRRA